MKRTETLQVRLTKDEKNHIKEFCKQQGYDQSSFTRDAIMISIQEQDKSDPFDLPLYTPEEVFEECIRKKPCEEALEIIRKKYPSLYKLAEDIGLTKLTN